jgi:hypothetical protein
MVPENDQAQRRTEHDQDLSFRIAFRRRDLNDDIFILRRNVLNFQKFKETRIFRLYMKSYDVFIR